MGRMLLSGCLEFGKTAAPPAARSSFGSICLVCITYRVGQNFRGQPKDLPHDCGKREMTTIGKNAAPGVLAHDEVRQIVVRAAAELGVTGKRVLTIIPDGTRTMPMPLMFQLLQTEIGTRASACDYLVALGTHPTMSEAQLTRMMGRPVVDGVCGKLSGYKPSLGSS